MVGVFLAVLSVIPAPEKVVELSAFSGFVPLTNAVSCVRDEKIAAEGYVLAITEKDGIVIRHADEAGAFYARKTLEQLVTPEGYPCVEISDRPRYAWRGVHLDEARHFFGKETVKRIIDLMAFYKMNVLHWHLTDDQGWRIAVPDYPDLVRYGAVRPSSPRHWRRGQQDGMRYGPFYYTEADLREIISYAALRHVLIVPEIEVPGHACAALAAYPDLACKPENMAKREPRLKWGISEDVLCVGSDQAVRFAEDVLAYVCRIFPGPYVHIGGDECPTVRWTKCAKCQKRIRDEGLASEKDLQPWLTRRLVAFLERSGKRAVGWDEFLNGDVPISAVGMSWRTGDVNGAGQALVSGAAAAGKGHDVVMAPWECAYFCLWQGLVEDPFEYNCGLSGTKVSLDRVYAFDPCADVPEDSRKHVLGGQCCLWSECIWNDYDLDWKMWPRTCAMAEVLWCGESRKPGFDDFKRRVKEHRRLLIRRGVNCAPVE